MHHELLKTVIFDQHEVIRNAEIVPREYRLEPAGNHVLTGLRRAGKSTLLHALARDLVASGVAWERIVFINFEDERLAEFRAEDFNDIVSVQSELSPDRGFYFFDEMQNVHGWEKFARRLADAKERVCITGSNAAMLGREIATTLGGRFFTRVIFPYSFREYLTAHRIDRDARALAATRSNGAIRKALLTYLREGGFPESLLYQARRAYVESIYQKALLGDVVARYRIRNPQALRLLLKKVAESVRSDISFSRLHALLKAIGLEISKDMVISYISYAEEAYLIFSIRNHFAKFADRESAPKYYFTDNGLLNLFLLEKNAALLENLTAIHLYRQYGSELSYLKSAKTGLDIDFYLFEEQTAIQVAWSLAGEARQREVAALVKLAALLPETRRFLIVTLEEEEIIQEGDVRIEVVPAYKFLLIESARSGF